MSVKRYSTYVYSNYRAEKLQFVIKTSQVTLHREKIAICSEIHTKHTNNLCGQNVEFVKAELVVHIVTTSL
jgi:hypothetical protein